MEYQQQQQPTQSLTKLESISLALPMARQVADMGIDSIVRP